MLGKLQLLFGAAAPLGTDRVECARLGGWAVRECFYGAPSGRALPTAEPIFKNPCSPS